MTPRFFAFLCSFSALVLFSGAAQPQSGTSDLVADGFIRSATNSMLMYGTGDLARHLRTYVKEDAGARDRLHRALNLKDGEVRRVAIGAHQSEIDYANLRLRRAGFEFFQFERDPSLDPVALDKPIPENQRLQNRWKWAGALLGPAIAFGAILIAGVAEAQSTLPDDKIVAGFVQSMDPPGFISRLSPYATMAVLAASYEIIFRVKSEWFYKHMWGTKYGLWWNFGVNQFYWSSVWFAGYLVSQLPRVVPFDHLSDIWLGNAVTASIFWLAMGFGQVYFSRLVNRGEMDQAKRIGWETGPLFYNMGLRSYAIASPRPQISIFGNQTPVVSILGQLIYFFSVTLPVIVKEKLGDKAYDHMTFALTRGVSPSALLSDGTHPLRRLRSCTVALSALADRFTFTKRPR